MSFVAISTDAWNLRSTLAAALTGAILGTLLVAALAAFAIHRCRSRRRTKVSFDRADQISSVEVEKARSPSLVSTDSVLPPPILPVAQDVGMPSPVLADSLPPFFTRLYDNINLMKPQGYYSAPATRSRTTSPPLPNLTSFKFPPPATGPDASPAAFTSDAAGFKRPQTLPPPAESRELPTWTSRARRTRVRLDESLVDNQELEGDRKTASL